MGCNNDCNTRFRNEERFEDRVLEERIFEERGFEESNFEELNSRRSCDFLANDVERLIRDIRRDANRLSREFDRLEDRGCIRNTLNASDDLGNWNGCRRCNCCN